MEVAAKSVALFVLISSVLWIIEAKSATNLSIDDENSVITSTNGRIAANVTTTLKYINSTTTFRPPTSNLTTSTSRYQTNGTTTTYRPVTTTSSLITTTSRPITTTYRLNTTLASTTSRSTVTSTSIPSTSTTRSVATIQCIYFQSPNIYGCKLRINNPNGQEFTSIIGPHHPQRSDLDVVKVSGKFQVTLNVPSIICSKFRNLVTLEVIWSQVSRLTAESFRSCSNLQVLELRGNVVTEIPPSVFISNQNLRVIGLARNRIENIASNAFSGSRLEELDIGYNELRTFNSSWFTAVSGTLRILAVPGNRISAPSRFNFENLRILESLDLSMNPLGNLQTWTFSLMTNLKHLKIDNCELEQLDADTFNGLSRLNSVSFSGNFIQQLPVGLFSSLPNLTDVSFMNNGIKSIDSRTFGSVMTRITNVHAQNNNLDSIDPDFFSSAQQLTEFFLTGNSCSIKNFIIGSDNRQSVGQELDDCLRRFRYVRCEYSGTVNVNCSMSIRNLIGIDDNEHVEGQLPSGTTNASVRVISVTALSSTKIIPSIICRQFPNLQELYMHNNGISMFSNETFRACNNLRVLSLIGQDITSIPDMIFAGLRSLEILDMSLNRVSVIGPGTLFGLGASMRRFTMNTNYIGGIESGTFSSLTGLTFISLANNNLRYLNSTAFGGSLSSLTEFNGSSNQIDKIDPNWFNSAINLNVLNLSDNSCVNRHFTNVKNNRTYVQAQLQACFR